VKENHIDLSHIFATQISTSKHLYDTTAHQYIEDNCLDLGLQTLKGLSADMNDLLNTKGQEEAISFWELVKYQRSHAISIPQRNRLVVEGNQNPINPALLKDIDENLKFTHKDVVIVTDVEDSDS